jgi:hypothetical protein
MALPIAHEMFVASGKSSAGAGLATFRTGARLEARIVEFTPEGRTVLQFPGFRAVAEKTFEGQIGDVVAFEVAADDPGDGLAAMMRGRPTLPAKDAAGNREGRPGPLDDLMRRRTSGAKTAASKASPGDPAATSPSISPRPSQAGHGSTHYGLFSLQTVQSLSAWIKRLQENVRPKHILRRIDERLDMAGRGPADRPGASLAAMGFGGFFLGPWPVWMKLQRRPAQRTGEAPEGVFSAVLFLHQEDAGALRVDVRMADRRLDVGFSVENEESRGRIAKALPELAAVLGSHAKNCYCHVEVAPPKIQALFMEGEATPETVGLDIRA